MRLRELRATISALLFGCSAAASDAPPAGYLVEQGYGFVGSPVPALSGWDADLSGGQCSIGSTLYIQDTSGQSGVTLKRRFCRQTAGQVVLEFHFKVSKKVDGLTWQLLGGETVAAKVVTSSGNLCYESAAGHAVSLCAYRDNVEIGVKVVVDLSSQRADYWVNGRLHASGVGLRNAVDGLDSFHLYTGESGTVALVQRQTNIWRGYLVNEAFLAQAAGAVPDDWTCEGEGGEAAVVSNAEVASYPDCIYACLTDTNENEAVSLTKTFVPQAGVLNFEFAFAQPVKADGFSAELRNAEGGRVTFRTQNGDLCCVASNGSPVTVWENYRSNLWYTVRLVFDPKTGAGDVMVNDIPKALGVGLATPSEGDIDAVRFSTSLAGRDAVWLDDIVLCPAVETPADYVPAPSPVPHGANLIGVQGCNLWREGSHYGWDWISSAPDRSPIIGYYDEQNPEVADWEIKFLVDHGVDFITPCWYRPQSGTGMGPVKNRSRRGVCGYKRAKYSSAIRYALIIETANAPMYSLGDWQNNVVPLLIEHYFKDPRYLVIGNKPVVAFFGGIRNTGDEAAARSAINSQCVAAGFAGATLIGCTTSSDAGFEYMYTYSKSFAAETVTNRISSPSVNWDRSAWDLPYQDAGAWRSAAEYRSQLLAQKSNLVSKVGLAQTMWLLGNWNEYGEGHFLMPTEGLGFRYLDVIREVFGDGSAHADVWPTVAQKARINVLYPQPRIVRPPADQNAVLGTSATFSTRVVGARPSAYQWQLNGGDVPGATNAFLTVGPALPENHRARVCVAVSNEMGRVVSAPATLNVFDYSPVCKMRLSFGGYGRQEALTNFPVRITFSPTMTNGFAYAQFASVKGYDLRVMNAQETQELNYEVESWDPNGESTVWVQVPLLTDTTQLVASWGNPAYAQAPAACVTNGSTWGGAYAAVWHMKEGSGATMQDSTVNTNHGTLYQGAAWADGVVGKALLLSGNKTNYVNAGKGEALSFTNRFSLSAWICPADCQTNAYYGLVNGVLSRGSSSAATLNYALECKNSTTVTFIKRTSAESLKFYDFTVPPLSNTWTLVTMQVADGLLTLFVNGVSCGSKAVGSIAPVPGSDALYLGCIVYNKGETAFTGLLDEVRIMNATTSSNWVWASWMTVASNDVFCAAGAVSGGRSDADLDGDGMTDFWEAYYFGSASAVHGGALEDWDQDGRCNRDEFVAGTCPTNAGSLLRIDAQAVDGKAGTLALSWPSVAGRRYAIQSSTNLAAGFDSVAASNVAATPARNTNTVFLDAAPCRFFRVSAEREEDP